MLKRFKMCLFPRSILASWKLFRSTSIFTDGKPFNNFDINNGTLYVCSNNGTQKYLSKTSKGFHILFSHDSAVCPIFTWRNWDLEQLKSEHLCLESISPQILAWDSDIWRSGSFLPDTDTGLLASLWSIYELWLY